MEEEVASNELECRWCKESKERADIMHMDKCQYCILLEMPSSGPVRIHDDSLSDLPQADVAKSCQLAKENGAPGLPCAPICHLCNAWGRANEGAKNAETAGTLTLA